MSPDSSGDAPGATAVPAPTALPAVDLRAWLDAVGEIAREANAATSVGTLVSRITAQSCQLVGFDFAAILLADARQERLIVEGAHGLSDEYIATYNAERPVAIGPGPLGEGPSSQAFRTRRAVAVPDTDKVPLFGPWNGVPNPLQPPYRAMLSVPLVTRDGAIGVLNCYTAEPRAFSAEEIALVEILADQAAIAFEAAGLRARERATIDELKRQHALLERADEIHKDLTRVVLESAGLPGIARALAGVLGCSVLIEDAAAQTLTAFEQGEAAAAALASRVRADLPKLTEQLAAQEQSRQLVELGGPDAVRFWVAPILVGAELVGRLWAGPVLMAAGLLDRRALEHGATVAALELLKQQATQEVEWRVRGDLLGDLLVETIADEPALLARARRLGHDLSGPQAMLVVRPDPAATLNAATRPDLAVDPSASRRPVSTSDLAATVKPGPADSRPEGRPGRTAAQTDSGEHRLTERLLETVGRAVDRRPGPRALVARHQDDIVALVPQRQSTPEPLGELAQQIVRSTRRPGLTVTLAVGPIAEQLGAIASSYRVARGALNLAQQAGRRDQVVMLGDLDVYGLLLQVERPEPLERFAQSLLDPLDQYDRRRGTELVPTLRTYLEHAFSVADTAAALVIHPHTLGYRLRRIEQLIGANLRRPETLLRLQLAFMIRDIVRL